MTHKLLQQTGSCKWREPESGRRKGMMEGDSMCGCGQRFGCVVRGASGGGVDTTQNSQLTFAVCVVSYETSRKASSPKCLANLMFTLTPNFSHLIAILLSVCVCLRIVFSSQGGFASSFTLPPTVPSALVVFIVVSLVSVMWTDVRQCLRLTVAQWGKGQWWGLFTHLCSFFFLFFWPVVFKGLKSEPGQIRLHTRTLSVRADSRWGPAACAFVSVHLGLFHLIKPD